MLDCINIITGVRRQMLDMTHCQILNQYHNLTCREFLLLA